jgi:ATP adenylyltransferase
VQRLWAPWRIEYLEREAHTDRCFLCESAASEPSGNGLVIWRGTLVYALLNAYPYANGHVLVAPYEHQGDLLEVSAQTLDELMAGVRLTMRALQSAYGPEGYNLGMNLGRAAGAGQAEHLHIHVVPRWLGDTNFMTAAADARVIPEALGRTAERLRRAVALIQEEVT